MLMLLLGEGWPDVLLQRCVRHDMVGRRRRGVAWRGEDVRIRIITKLADRESGAQTSKTSQARKTLLACRRAALIRA